MRRRLRRLGSPTIRYLVPALAVGVFVEIGLRTTTLPRLSGMLGVPLHLGPARPGGPPLRLVSPWRLGRIDAARYQAARRVMRLWPGGGETTCLRVALVAGFLLRRRRPTLHLGVAHVDGRTRAHAWIVVDDLVVDPLARYYVPLTGTAT